MHHEFEKFAQEGNEFINRLAKELQDPENKDHAYRVMNSVFQVLRDIITPEESMHLISQLPMMLKAVYVNGWELGPKERLHSMKEFIDQLRLKNKPFGSDFADDEMAMNKAKSVLKMLKAYLSPDETEDIIGQFPSELLELWATQVDEVHK